MAIPTNHIDKITDHDSGESRPICPPAEHVSVDNENYEGETLDEVLDEVAQSIEEAGQGGYAPPPGGIPKSDLAQSVQDSLDKADSALQDEDVAEVAKTGDYNDLEHKPTIPDTSGLATKTELATKQDKLQAGNGIVIANDGKTVSVAEAIRTGAAAGATAVQPSDLNSAMATKQNTLTFDDEPTEDSSNPVSSGGVYNKLATKQDALVAGNGIVIAQDGKTVSVAENIQVSAGKLKVLVIGNSFACDSWSYFPFILKEGYGIDIDLALLYNGGATLNDYVLGYTSGLNRSDRLYQIDTSVDIAWNISNNVMPHDAVTLKEWDLIVLQQYCTDTYDLSEWTSGVQSLIALIDGDCNYRVRYGWNITHISPEYFSSDDLSHCRDMLEFSKRQPAEIIFPYGTAVYNAMEYFKLKGTNGYMTEDQTGHLQEGLPCYLAALTNVQALLDQFYQEKRLSVIGDSYTPSDSKRIGGGQADGEMIPMTATDRYMCQVAAMLANKDKFKINPIDSVPQEAGAIQNLCKLEIVDEEPQNPANDTIYAQVNDVDSPTEIESLWIAGLEFTGGGLPAGVPQISKPARNSTINLGTAYGQGGATGTVKIKGRSLTANSTVVVSVGSGFSLSYGQQSGSSINIDAADVILGCDVTVYATVYATSGTILITSQTDNLSVEANLTSDVVEDLAGIKQTGSQWIQTDYYPNANTEFVLTVDIDNNNNTQAYPWPEGLHGAFFTAGSETGKPRFSLYAIGRYQDNVYGAYNLLFNNENSNQYNGAYQSLDYKTRADSAKFLSDGFKIKYEKSNGHGVLSAEAADGTGQKAVNTSLKTTTQESPLKILGGKIAPSQDDLIQNMFDVTIKSLVITENGNEVRHWVPKKKNGIVGLYDTVNKTFIHSTTGTEFVAVPLTDNN